MCSVIMLHILFVDQKKKDVSNHDSIIIMGTDGFVGQMQKGKWDQSSINDYFVRTKCFYIFNHLLKCLKGGIKLIPQILQKHNTVSCFVSA